MITFIIPTLWKSDRIFKTIESFESCKNMDAELIIIDNAQKGYASKDYRVTVIKPKSNIFVNPSWSIGVTLAQNKYVCLLNDDISINIDFLVRKFNTLIQKDSNFGMIGLYKDNLLNSEINTFNDFIELTEINDRGYGFGCMMILKKENYIKIPDCFKIFFGDDYLYFYNKDLMKRKIYWIQGLKTPGEVSVTSKEFEDSHMQQEHTFWDQEIQTLINKNK
jgi:hypothetical protein